jgi:hypothetical protein
MNEKTKVKVLKMNIIGNKKEGVMLFVYQVKIGSMNEKKMVSIQKCQTIFTIRRERKSGRRQGSNIKRRA